jgi:hypothetical protein
MALHVFLFLLVICLLSLARLGRHDWLNLPPSHTRGGVIHSTAQRLLKPRTPDDCPTCRLASTLSPRVEPAPGPVHPWREGKSRRGAPKRVNTEGFACPNRKCPSFGITDAHMHARVGDGKHGQAERIQTFRYPACHATFTRPAQHAPLPSENLLAPGRHGALCGFPKGWILPRLGGSQGYRQATITSLSGSRWRTCTDLARALLPPSPPSAPPVGRTAHQAAQRQERASFCGWPSTPSRKVFRSCMWAPAHKTQRMR